ncbi:MULTISPECIES: ABC transporter ATP-binding protein/permease [unclassified Viridibacillus]|uniref:ABC transporter ATP-binding protein/permease n=1 Tax=unclassified Viridibacillus TaxID=2617942 RepID=UPI00096D6BE8|nr:ABC transporter ATP-binding protein/permease [Viridibacillus sp. FSL H8-0123]OMC80894.1 macrolide ABC transporter ATP-binding protein/permease [Viridibacillus sp. FSL H8-0123]
MIQINNLTKRYNHSLILEDTSFNFPSKGLVCLLGASGSGKSTLLNMVAGFDSEYSGDITVCGTSISKMNADELCTYRRDNIGFIFQNYHLLSGYTVLENILLSCELNAASEEENRVNAKELLNKLGLSQKTDEKIENLSGGQKQRVAIARALISNPRIILADEPTGALDRRNSNEIMELLKEVSKDRLVIVITHDQKICSFADEVVHIEKGKIIANDTDTHKAFASFDNLSLNKASKVSAFKQGIKNFKVHITRYMAVSLAISIGILVFMLSLSSGNIMDKNISDFQDKNTAFNNGYIKGEDDGTVIELLKSDERIENVYYQYKITDVTLRIGDKTEALAEKYPMTKATEKMSYGAMPKTGEKEIALSPSLAKKFGNDISSLIGKEVILNYGDQEYTLTISGIFNEEYDDFFVSSDIEQKFYQNVEKEKNYSISYDVKNFEDIVSVSQTLADKKIESKTAAKEVEALQSTFNRLTRLFLIVSILILAIGLFISTVLLIKLQNSRYKEMGLLSALGYNKGTIRKMIVSENLLLATISAISQAVLIVCTYLVGMIFNLAIIITPLQILLSILSTGVVVSVISMIASHKLISTEPAVALRK